MILSAPWSRTALLPSLALLLAVGAARPDPGTDLVITEFMAKNESVLADGFGAHPDWVEIHNAGAQEMELAGWRLLDSQQSWTFPPQRLASGGYLVVFASGRALPGSKDPAGNLHATFALDAEGEGLALVDPSGRVASEYPVPVPPQHDDVSYGMLMEQTRLVTPDSPARWFVPTDSVDEAWRGAGSFDDSTWNVGAAAVGYNLDPGPVLGPGSPLVAYQVAEGTSGTQDYGGSLGMDFVVLQPVLVTQLGVFDDGGDGLRATLTAQLWRRDDRGTPGAFADDRGAASLARLTFTPTAPGVRVGGSRFKMLDPPLVLSPGSYTIVAYGYNSAERNGNTGTGSGAEALTTESGGGVITFLGQSRYGAAGTFPTTVDGGPEDRYAAGTFMFHLATDPDMRTDVRALMYNRGSILLLRVPFELGEANSGTSFVLRVGHDDGFVAWLNGMELTRSHAPSALDPGARATAAGNGVAVAPFTFRPELLRTGQNVLTIAGLNLAPDDRDFVLVPELAAVRIEKAAHRYFRRPTPGAPNEASSVIGFARDPVFSVERGFYETPFEVAITTPTPGARVRYTLDGSTPSTVQGLLYAEPVKVEGTTVLRAVAWGDGLEPSRVVSHTYLFLHQVAVQSSAPAGYPASWGSVAADYGMVTNASAFARAAGNAAFTMAQAQDAIAISLRALPSLCITTDRADLFDKARGLYLNPAGRGENWERPVSAELLMPDGSPGFEINAGLQVMGYTSRNLEATPKLSFRLLFERKYGPAWLRYPFFGPDAAPQFNSIALRANSRDTWVAEYSGFGTALYLADQWAKQTQADMGQPAPHGRFVHLYLNGLYWGIYNPTERPDAAFASSYLGGERADFDVIKFCCPHLVEDGDMAAWNELLTACRAGVRDDASYQRLQGNRPDGTRDPALPRLLDVDNFIDYTLNGQFHASVDWPGNYYAARDAVDGRSEGFKFFHWDNDLAFSGSQLNANKVRTDPGSGWWTTSPGEVEIALRQNAEYRLRFADRVYRHCFHDGALTPKASIARWRGIAVVLEPALYAESARWGDSRASLRTVQDHWRRRSDAMVSTYFPARTATLLNQLRSYGLYPRLDAPEFDPPAGQVSFGTPVRLSGAAAVLCTLDGSDPRLPGGSANPQALRLGSTASLVLERTSTLRARSWDGTNWSALHEARFVIGRAPRPGDLVISELDYHPAAPNEAERLAGFDEGEAFEFLELLNRSGEPLDLRGLRFRRGLEFDWAESTVDTLEPGECLLLVADQAAFILRHGTSFEARIAGEFDGGTHLANGGERLLLEDAVGTVLLDLTYDDAAPWPPAADGQGLTLVLEDPAALTNPDAWRSSLLGGGTPGEVIPWWMEWWRAHFTAAERADAFISGSQADPDADGLSNGLELATGSDPRQASPAAGRLAARLVGDGTAGGAEDSLELRFRRPVGTKPSMALEVSADLLSWSGAEGQVTLVSRQRDPGGIWEEVEFRRELGVGAVAPSHVFWRLRVVGIPEF